MANNTAALPKIKESDVQNARKEQLGFLLLFFEKYLELINDDESDEVMNSLNSSQKTLMAFICLNAQAAGGGFMQLIKNGFGKIIFEDTFSETLKSWGAEKAAEIIDEGKEWCIKYKDEIEKTGELNNVLTKAFKVMDNIFYGVMEEEVKNVKKYIENNINEFAVIV
jgi:hypothetical protein